MPGITVKGMSCEHCRASVTEALRKIPGLSEPHVDLKTGGASWKDADPAHPVPLETVREAVKRIGFEAM